jgi:hypothetical protein
LGFARHGAMAVLFFLPWLTYAKEVAIGDVKLLPYERDRSPGPLGAWTQADMDAILGAYANRPWGLKATTMGTPVPTATIVHWPIDEGGGEVDDEEVRRRFSFGQALTFGCLAEREYGRNGRYCNADTTAMIAQRFKPGSAGGTAITSRRRDGYRQDFGGKSDVPLFLRPRHVDSRPSVEFDQEFVAVAAKVLADPQWAHVAHAVTVFNRANTDSPDTTDGIDLVLMRVAFEALLGANHKSADLKKKLVAHFDPLLPVPPVWSDGEYEEDAWSQRWPLGVSRPLDAWVQDFCAARNNRAHGSGAAESYPPPLWSDANHLLFASLLFPLAVKLLLDGTGAYPLTAKDRDLATHCERFLSRDLLAYNEDTGRIPWDEVLEDIQMVGFVRSSYGQ